MAYGSVKTVCGSSKIVRRTSYWISVRLSGSPSARFMGIILLGAGLGRLEDIGKDN